MLNREAGRVNRGEVPVGVMSSFHSGKERRGTCLCPAPRCTRRAVPGQMDGKQSPGLL